jgi:hypothetical protein
MHGDKLREMLEAASDANHALLNCGLLPPCQLWDALHVTQVELGKALDADAPAAPVDIAHKLVGANGLVLG